MRHDGAVTARDPAPFIPALRALQRVGIAVVVVATGSDASRHAAEARGAGLAARVATLDRPWREAERLLVA